MRSLRSSVLRWPDRETVHRAVVDWLDRLLDTRTDVARVGYFGSYARGDWGFGSDLDLIVVLDTSAMPFQRRSLGQDILGLPVSVDLLVYTTDEWRGLGERNTRFYREVMNEAVWVRGADQDRPVYPGADEPPPARL